MKTAIIHPEDPTTQFLSPIYSKEWGYKVDVYRGFESKKILQGIFDTYDQIIMCGHGTQFGLLVPSPGGTRELGTQLVEAMRENQHKLVLVWCHAREFCQRYGIVPKFATSMWISEESEALEYQVTLSEGDLSSSNEELTNLLIRACIDGDIRTHFYKRLQTPVSKFNLEGILYG